MVKYVIMNKKNSDKTKKNPMENGNFDKKDSFFYNLTMLRKSSMEAKSEVINQEHPYNLQKAIAQFERGYLMNILQLSNGNKDKASEMLGIRIKTLDQKIKKYRITI